MKSTLETGNKCNMLKKFRYLIFTFRTERKLSAWSISEKWRFHVAQSQSACELEVVELLEVESPEVELVHLQETTWEAEEVLWQLRTRVREPGRRRRGGEGTEGRRREAPGAPWWSGGADNPTAACIAKRLEAESQRGKAPPTLEKRRGEREMRCSV